MFRKHVNHLVYGFVIAFLFISIAGCGKKETAQKEIDVYTIADPTGDWGFPSPYGHYPRGPGYIRMSFIFDTLVWKDDKGFVPALAESWKYLKTENAYLFKLRKGIRWHDGHKFSAHDVVFTFEYIKKHPYIWVDSRVVKKVEGDGDYSVKIYLSGLYAPFLNNVAGTMPILPKHIYRDIHEPEICQNKKAAIGTGPYMLSDYDREHGSYLYTAYKEYYQGTPKIKIIKIIRISNEMSANSLLQGRINATAIPAELVESLKNNGMKILSGSHDWVARMMINHNKKPLNNKSFRRAISCAINRQVIVDTCLRGHGLAASPGLMPSDNQWHNSMAEQHSYDPAKAEKILISIGYKRKGKYLIKNGYTPALELLLSGGGSSVAGAPGERVGEMIKKYLEKVGIKITLTSLESKTLDKRVGEWRFDLALSGHGGLGGDPATLNRVILDLGFGKGSTSARYMQNKNLISLLKKQLQEMDDNKRRVLIAGIQEAYANDAPCAPLYYPTWHWAHDGNLELYYTMGGISIGVPIPMNKMSFCK